MMDNAMLSQTIPKNKTTANVELRLILYGPSEKPLTTASDAIINAFSGNATTSQAKPNREGNGYHILMSIFVKEAR